MPMLKLCKDTLEVLPLCLAAAASGLVVTSMFVLAPFIVLAVGGTSDRQAIGFWSGTIVSAFYLGRILTAPAWGWLADRYGRRSALALSLAATSAATFVCGLASSIRSVTAVRFATGCLSAVQATCHAMAWELQEARGTAMVESAWTFASMLGPSLAVLCWDLQAKTYATWAAPHFAACAVLAVLQAVPVPFLPPETLEPRAPYGDRLGSASCSAASRCLSAHEADPLQRGTGSRQMRILALNCVNVFLGSAMDEVSVLFGVGRLGLSEKGMGAVFLLAGAMDLVLQNTVLLRIVGEFPEEKVRLWAIAAYVPPLAIMPMALSQDLSVAGRVLGLALTILLRKVSSYLFTVTNTVLLNRSVKEGLASVHGQRLVTASVMQMAGPFLGSVAYAWFATSGRWPLHGDYAVFIGAEACVLLMCAMARAGGPLWRADELAAV